MKQQIRIPNINLNHLNVQSVIEIAEEIIAENKLLNIDNLYHRAKRKLKIPRKGLLTIIQFLENKKVIIDRSKFTKRSVLSNKNRKQIYKFIKNNIGAHLSLIRKNVKLDAESTSSGTGRLLWHLDMLIKFRIIKKLSIKNYVIVLPFDIDDNLGKVFFLLRDDLNFKIISLLSEEKVLKQSVIYKKLEEYYHLNNLIEYSVIGINENKEVIININYLYLILDALKVLNKCLNK